MLSALVEKMPLLMLGCSLAGNNGDGDVTSLSGIVTVGA
jgi:hypothetical protein